MALRDDLNNVTLNQTKYYKDEPPVEEGVTSPEYIDSINQEILGESNNQTKQKRDNPFKNKKTRQDKPPSNKNPVVMCLIAVGVILAITLFYFGYVMITADKGAVFFREMEEEVVAPFQYTIEERDTLRVNGFTADDIERFEVEERNPFDLVTEAEQAREDKYDIEIKPYLDGASPEFNNLKSLTWLGTGTMSSLILATPTQEFEERYGTYNCDYIKITPMGSQLFLKLQLVEYNTSIFMTVTAQRYNELADTGNIVVTVDYNKYIDNSILVTNVAEKDIKS